MKESSKKRLRVQNDFNFDRYAIVSILDADSMALLTNQGRLCRTSDCISFRIPPSSWELNAPIAPDEPDMDEYQSRTLQDVLGSIYSGFGFSSEVETPAISAAPSRRSSNRSSIRSAHSIKLKRKNRNELIFGNFFPVQISSVLKLDGRSWFVDPYLTKSFQT